jgi:uncharacterized membrane protein
VVWGLILREASCGVKVFFRACVLVPGLCGAAAARCKILFVQALAAAIGRGFW